MTVQYYYHIGKVGDDMSQPRMEIQESATQGNYLGNGTGKTANTITIEKERIYL